MSRFLYTVQATLPDAETAQRYRRWLEEGHVEEVVRLGGAASAWIVDLEADRVGAQERVEVVYVFRERAGFEAYERDHAPRLREEGVALFGPQSGVRFERRLGTTRAQILGAE